MSEGIQRRPMLALSAGHSAVDFAAGGVAALLPFWVERFDLSYTRAALLMLASTAASSLLQPAFGLLSDRRGGSWALPFGVLLAGLGTGLAAVAPGYGLVLVLVFASGVGVAAFHPAAAMLAGRASGRRRATGMSYFNVGGNAGYALGPVVFTALVGWLGLSAGGLAVVPVLLIGVVLWASAGRLAHLGVGRRARGAASGETRVGAMALLSTVVVLRGSAWFALITFVPLAVVADGGTKSTGNHLLALMLLAGAAGTLLVGTVADRIGLRRALLLTQIALPVAIVGFVLAGASVLGAAALVVIGMCVVGSFGVTMVLSQQYLPHHVGVASGLSIGLQIGLGGVSAVALGALADAIDLRTALIVSAAAPALGIALCFLLPAERRVTRLAASPASP